jgi:hypothetical protein
MFEVRTGEYVVKGIATGLRVEGRDTHQVCEILKKAAEVAECINPSNQPHATVSVRVMRGVA